MMWRFYQGVRVLCVLTLASLRDSGANPSKHQFCLRDRNTQQATQNHTIIDHSTIPCSHFSTSWHFDVVRWCMQSAACHLDFVHCDQIFFKSGPSHQTTRYQRHLFSLPCCRSVEVFFRSTPAASPKGTCGFDRSPPVVHRYIFIKRMNGLAGGRGRDRGLFSLPCKKRGGFFSIYAASPKGTCEFDRSPPVVNRYIFIKRMNGLAGGRNEMEMGSKSSKEQNRNGNRHCCEMYC